MAWLRSLEERDAKARKRAAANQKRLDKHDAVLDTCPDDFRVYYKELNIKMKLSEVKECSDRFVELSAALRERGLELRLNSQACVGHVFDNFRQVSRIVDDVEEAMFIIAHTKCSEKDICT